MTKGKSASLEARETAFRFFRENGGNVEATVRALKKTGYLGISKTTLYAWIEKYNFRARLTDADAKRQKVEDVRLSFEDNILFGLDKQKEKYEAYFESLGRTPDHQAQHAYTNLLQTMLNIKSKLGADRHSLTLQALKDFVLFLQKEDPAAVNIIEKNLDAFADHVREKYAG